LLKYFRKTLHKLLSVKTNSNRTSPAVPLQEEIPPESAEPASVTSAPEAETATKPPRPRRRRKPRSAAKATSHRAPSPYAQHEESLTLPDLKEIPAAEGKTRFTDFDIAKEVLCGIQDLGFEYCTPIQDQCLSHALAGKDVTGRAQTGTGKTAAFLTSALTFLLRNPKEDRKPGACRVLVLAPTRELAVQINKDAEDLGKYCRSSHLAVFGGMGFEKQREGLKKPIDILVGTPGRIIDYITRGDLDVSKTEILVIDEADRMLDMGFIPHVRRIVNKMPPAGARQTMMFSATLTDEIVQLQSRWLVDPIKIETEPETVVADLIEQKFYSVSCQDKLALLLWILKNDQVQRMLVFCNRKIAAEKVAMALQRHGVESGLISGDIPQQKRLRILEEFRAGKTPVLVATDVAARGLHVDAVSHVVIYELPDDPEDYVHRVGRTGRAGETGKSIAFACEYGGYLIPQLEEFLDCKVVCINPTEEMLALPPRSASFHRGERKPMSPRRGAPGPSRRRPERKSPPPAH
jgi:ATP-dependent RNA helicase RhlB